MNPPYACPRCGERMYAEDLGEWWCFTCGERFYTRDHPHLDDLIEAVAAMAEKDASGNKHHRIHTATNRRPAA